MSLDTVIFWLFVLAWVAVLALIVFVQLPRIIGEVQRMIKHILRLTDDSQFSVHVTKAQLDAARIEVAVSRVPALRQRAIAALELIRETPILPPQLLEIERRLRREIAAFRAFR